MPKDSWGAPNLALFSVIVFQPLLGAVPRQGHGMRTDGASRCGTRSGAGEGGVEKGRHPSGWWLVGGPWGRDAPEIRAESQEGVGKLGEMPGPSST